MTGKEKLIEQGKSYNAGLSHFTHFANQLIPLRAVFQSFHTDGRVDGGGCRIEFAGQKFTLSHEQRQQRDGGFLHRLSLTPADAETLDLGGHHFYYDDNGTIKYREGHETDSGGGSAMTLVEVMSGAKMSDNPERAIAYLFTGDTN
jgi:hypothetical protein